MIEAVLYDTRISWYNPMVWGLWVLSIVYRCIVTLRHECYDRGIFKVHRLPNTVISVGNIVLGGSGKTPVVMRLVELMEDKHCAVLTRGYRSGLEDHEWLVLLNGDIVEANHHTSNRQYLFDEARLQSKSLPTTPIIVGARRFEAAQYYLTRCETVPDVWLLDDGFQHRKIYRDIDVLLWGERSTWGNQQIFPLGPLRESVQAAKRASAILRIPSGGDGGFSDLPERVPVFEFHRRNLAPECVHRVKNDILAKGESVHVICGIARPDQFVNAVTKFGFMVKKRTLFNDHAPIILGESDDGLPIVTTAKDYWRDPSIFQQQRVDVFILPLVVDLEEKFSEFLTSTT